MQTVRHIKKGDNVIALSGNNKGSSGKVLSVDQKSGRVQVEGIGIQKKHQKPTQQNTKGGIVEQLRWWPASKFQACDSSGKALGRTGYEIKDGKKLRVYSKKRK
ncbi:50S ribosomal protein L24 [bacterium]|nr:50S ribosomal protein L24 [bacterium]